MSDWNTGLLALPELEGDLRAGPVIMQGQWSREDLFHEGLVVLLGDRLVGNQDITVQHFRIRFFLN
jgi:hypothetical protein